LIEEPQGLPIDFSIILIYTDDSITGSITGNATDIIINCAMQPLIGSLGIAVEKEKVWGVGGAKPAQHPQFSPSLRQFPEKPFVHLKPFKGGACINKNPHMINRSCF
jgi:hypothetical protein